jgi:ribosomal protein S12 methylthiotransferase
MKVHVTTLGCAKNLYDSEILMGQIQANKIPLVENPYDANVIIVNTCGFINPAKQESIDAILEAVQIKKEKPNTHLIVCGCLSTRYQLDLKKEIPEVNRFFGTEYFSSILKFLNLELKSPKHLFEHRLLSQKSHYAYLKISEGCNHRCAFCAIPLMRGKHKSRPIKEIVKEAELLVQNGVKELILIAQDTTSYGIDLYQKQQLIDLLKKLEKIENLQWIRIHYMYPTTLQYDLIDLIAQSEKIVNYVDLPLQHITDNMLKTMKRNNTSGTIINILNRIRQIIPDVAIRTTFIVGHPGETDEDFKILEDFIKEYRFERLGIFTYSPEENTSASSLPHPSTRVAKERHEKLMSIQRQISLEKNLLKIGNTYKILIDEVNKESKVAIGRTYADSPEIDNEVIIDNITYSVEPGKFFMVKVKDAIEYTLYGQILEA